MRKDLNESFVRICQFIGRAVPMWNQGAGGNVSVKDNEHLWIKASGRRLDAVSATQGFACVRLPEFHKCFSELKKSANTEADYSQLIRSSSDSSLGRPSMETGFHAVLPGRWVLHFHSLAAILMAEFYFDESKSQKMKSWLKEKLNKSFEFIQNHMPGWSLSHTLSLHPHASVYILQNHGLILQFQDSEDAEKVLEFLKFWQTLEKEFFKDFGLSTVTDEWLQNVQKQPGHLRYLFPDAAVYASQLKSVLQKAPGDSRFQLSNQASLDLREIWWATRVLETLYPQISELDANIVNHVASLPTEKARLGVVRADS